MYEMNTLELIGSIIGAVFGSRLLEVGVTSFFNKKKTRVEADATMVDSTLKWAEAMNTRLTKLENDLETLRKENLQLHIEVSSLRTEVSFYKIYYPAPPSLTTSKQGTVV